MPRREQLEEMLKSQPDDVFLNYALAKICVAEGDIAGGLSGFDRVIAIDPDYVAAYFQKGQTLADQGDLEAARKTIENGIVVAHKVGDEHAEREMSEFLQCL